MIKNSHLLNLSGVIVLILVFIILSCSQSYAQSGSTNPRNYSHSDVGPDDDDSTVVQEPEKKEKSARIGMCLYGDIGMSSVINQSYGFSGRASGLCGAVGAQMNMRLNKKNAKRSVFLAAGLEARTFNAAFFKEDEYGARYDNYHYYFTGVPLTLRVIGERKNTSRKPHVSYYAEVAMLLGIKIHVTDFVSDNGSNNSYNATRYYNAVHLHPMASGGAAFFSKNNIFLLGPYIGYTISNLSNQSNSTAYVLNGGLRLSMLICK